MSDSIDLAELSATYPDPDDEDFTLKLAPKKEFLADATRKHKFGDLYPHQSNVVKLTGPKGPINEMAIIWATGKGKGTLVANMIRQLIDLPKRFGPAQRFLIIVRKSIIDQWKAELSRYPEFTTEKLREAPESYAKAQSQQGALSMSIKKTVILARLDTFAGKLEEMSNEEIREKYGKIDFIAIDEVHVMRTLEIPKMGKDGIIESTVLPKRKKGERRTKKSNEADPDLKISYIQMRRLFQLTYASIKLVMTATPMYDVPEELCSVLSFILPNDRQLEIIDLQKAISEGPQAIRAYLESKLRGRVSFMAEGDGLAPWVDEGATFTRIVDNEEVESTFKVLDVPMSIEQQEVYERVRPSGDDDGLDVKSKETFYEHSRMACNFVYLDPRPGHSADIDGFPKVKSKKDIEKRKKLDLPPPELYVTVDPPLEPTDAEKEEGKRRTNLKPFRFKFRFERELFANCQPRNRNLKQFGEGSELDLQRLEVIRRMSGKAARIIELVHNDVLRPGEGEVTYYYHTWIRNGGGILLGMCFDLMGYDRFEGLTDDASKLSDRPRYAFMMGPPGSTDARNRNIKKVANSPLNAFGQKVMIIIASDVSATGLGLTNIRKFIAGGPSFNLMSQPEGRARRTDSHRAFPRPEQKFVRRYYLASTLQGGGQTVDHLIWWQIEQKGHDIKPVSEGLRDISVDCPFNNRLGTCWSLRKAPKAIAMGSDLTTYHLHWAQREFDEIEKQIRHFYLLKTSYSFEELAALLSDAHDIKTITWSLAQMLDRREVIRDRMGFLKVLREDNGTYFLASPAEELGNQTEFNTTHGILVHDRFLEEYTKTVRVAVPESFTAIATQVIAETTEDIMHAGDLASFQKSWNGNSMSGEARVIWLERALAGRIDNRNVAEFIMRELEAVWFDTGKTIFHYLEEMRLKGNASGSNANRRGLGNTKDVAIRIMTKGDREFRRANPGEVNMATALVEKRWQEREAKIKAEFNLPFTVIRNTSADGRYRIRNDAKVILKADGTPDGRGNRGLRVDLHTSMETVMPYLWAIQMENEDREPEMAPDDMEELLEDVTVRLTDEQSRNDAANWDRDRLVFYWRWLTDASRKPSEIAAKIAAWAEERGIVSNK